MTKPRKPILGHGLAPPNVVGLNDDHREQVARELVAVANTIRAQVGLTAATMREAGASDDLIHHVSLDLDKLANKIIDRSRQWNRAARTESPVSGA